jgi:uncharacterized protein involved in outer membrane biogenesis
MMLKRQRNAHDSLSTGTASPETVMATPASFSPHEWRQQLGSLRPTFPPAWTRRLRLAVLVAAALFLLLIVGSFLAVPPLAKWQIRTIAREQLGREASVGNVAFNPFTLDARISDFKLADRDPARTLLAFESLDLNLSMSSLRRLAPVLDAVRLRGPRLEIARDAQGRLNVQDLIDRALAPTAAKPGEKKAAFAVNNIEIEEGTLVVDDVAQRHRTEIRHFAIGIPFLSSFASDAEIRVAPYVRGQVDGAPFALAGRTTSPFLDVQRATLDINLDRLALPRYVEYAPPPAGLKLTAGDLTTRLSLDFLTWKGKPRGITLTGSARLDGLAVARRDDSPLAAVRSIDVNLGALDVLARSVRVNKIVIDAPELDLRRHADGALELQQLFTPAKGAPAASAPAASAPAAAPWTWSVNEARLSGGSVRILDEAVAPAFRTRLTGITLGATGLAARGPAGKVDIAMDVEDGARIEARSDVDVAAGAARGRFAVSKLPVATLYPYLASALAVDLRRGHLDFGADFDFAAAPQRLSLAGGAFTLSDLDIAIRGERDALWRMGHLGAGGIALDLGERTVALETVEASKGALRLLRDADGTLHFQRALRAAPSRAATAAPAAVAPAGADWNVHVGRFAVEGLAVDFEDRAVEPAARVRVADLRLAAENLDTRAGSIAQLDLAARVGAKGRVQVRGTASARPLAIDARVGATGFDLVPLRPYFESQTNVILTSGAVDAKGRLTYRDAPAQARFVGDIAVNDFGSLDRPASQELLRWKRLTVSKADVTSAPFKLVVGGVELDRFYARLILDAEARLNVMRLLQREGEAAATPEAAAPAAAAPATQAPAPATPAPAARDAIPATIGSVRLTNGEVEFSDFFVKPNYSVHLTDFDGTVSALDAARAGEVAVTARIDASAPVEIRGTVNPFAPELTLDLVGKATDIDLPALTPYSVKYAGYGIQKGKLTMEVKYRVENRKLAASNKLVLDQLTFGERVESPTATKLPVLLAVALLKDRNGVINLDLPIQGTLDDPQFSVWRVVVQIFVNLLAKAATAPFALLGAIVGGGGEQLAYVEFAPGSAALAPAAEAKLGTLAKALVDRPGLKLDIAGRAIPDADREGLRRAALERALRTQKQKDLARSGESAPALADIAIDAGEREKYLARVYSDTRLPDKPRNFIGIAKDVPAAQMESMLLASYPVDEAALRELADHRAQAAKEWIATRGNVPRERVFVLASRVGTEGLKGEGAPTRADFAIR